VDLTLSTRRFAHAVSIDAPASPPTTTGFTCRPRASGRAPAPPHPPTASPSVGAGAVVRGTVTALNAETTRALRAARVIDERG